MGPVSMHSDGTVKRLARTACLCDLRLGWYAQPSDDDAHRECVPYP